MGRLFWKFFFAFWLALLTAGIGVGTAVWLRHSAQQNQTANQADVVDVRRASLVKLAASTLPHGGIKGLHDFMQTLQNTRFPPIYAVDDMDRELLGRPLAAEVLQQARALYLKNAYPDAIQMVAADDGHRYLLFVPLPEHGFGGLFRQSFPGNPGLPPMGFDGSMPGDRPPPPPGAPEDRGRSPRREPPSPILPIVSGGLASLLFSGLLAWYFAKPIRSLRDAFSAVAQGRLNTRIGKAMGRRGDELADLGRDFDHMAQQICSLINAQQHLLHDVSHELRSPLARIQAAIGLAQQQPEKLPATLERIERESQRISDLVGELLMLSKLEAGVATGKLDLINLDDLLADIVADARFEAEPKRIELIYQGTIDASVECQSELLHRAIENVLRNAVQHCKADGTVLITADFDSDNRRLRIRVDDEGPGVADQDLTAIFQPFFRSGQPQKTQSTGLGLTIAHRAIEAHGGSISASNRPQGGLSVAIEIPFPTRQAI
ncbi:MULTISPECIES: ATP-binding protein [Methylomonas]|uniref:histidine kinase n=2 Tax=Methylomonas TaxID=416 RepID=A0A126T149_9GAMM|nr:MULTISPECIES: ATP-binding protein [Methylomonas]AMK75808.1 histidine kinase [Methylomonas denitrificans]OAH98563.1 two-component sensor histidine kinase [Methylomonas methanica]TCV80165.1 signal transduction histidine kinase [Methylomonas methanica]